MPNKQFEQLITSASHSLIMLNATNTEILFVKVWFTDQNGKKLEIEDNVNMTYDNWIVLIKNEIFNRLKILKTC